ncbi:MAG: NAD-dependent epimerase/dehydratase family protein [Planctomycetota bacterium]|nr:NAD-dependent epimerase/dehydratase family protein [Planctomycetota bacterium]
MSGLDLVVGGAGFIGSHLTDALLERGRRVRVLDDFATGYRHNLEAALGALRFELMEGDAADAATARAACAGVERIFHFGARPSVPWSVAHPREALRANHGTTLALLEAASAAGVRGFVFSSSSAIYGERPELPKQEDQEPDPRSPYAEHKWMGEQALRASARAGGPAGASLRYFNVYGQRQDPSSPYSGVISIFAREARAGRAPTIHGDGGQTRDFVHVNDVVRANLLAAEHLPLPGEDPAPVFNVGRGNSVSILELWEAVCGAAGVAPPPPPSFSPTRAGDVRHSRADAARAERLLGWSAQIDLVDGLRDTLREDRL